MQRIILFCQDYKNSGTVHTKSCTLFKDVPTGLSVVRTTYGIVATTTYTYTHMWAWGVQRKGEPILNLYSKLFAYSHFSPI